MSLLRFIKFLRNIRDWNWQRLENNLWEIWRWKTRKMKKLFVIPSTLFSLRIYRHSAIFCTDNDDEMLKDLNTQQVYSFVWAVIRICLTIWILFISSAMSCLHFAAKTIKKCFFTIIEIDSGWKLCRLQANWTSNGLFQGLWNWWGQEWIFKVFKGKLSDDFSWNFLTIFMEKLA